MEENGYDFDKAASIAIKRNKHMFEDLLEDDDDSDSDSQSENYEDEDADDSED